MLMQKDFKAILDKMFTFTHVFTKINKRQSITANGSSKDKNPSLLGFFQVLTYSE